MTPAAPMYCENAASKEEIHGHLRACNHDHQPPLERRVDLLEYAGKICKNAETFEAWSDGSLVGLVAAYLNDGDGRTGYVTNVSVTREFMGQGVAWKLMGMCLKRAAGRGIEVIALEVTPASAAAITMYRKLGFEDSRKNRDSIMMQLALAMD